MRINNKSLVLDGTDLTANIVSNPIYLAHVANYSIQIVFSGTTVSGVFKLQGSNDFGAKEDQIDAASITNWTDLAGSSETVTTSGDILWTVDNAGYKWVRLVWTDTASATASITSYRYMTKGV